VRVGAGASWLWRWLYRVRWLKQTMPQWAVVVEATPDPARRRWPASTEGVVVNFTVWARTIEEAEGLAQLAAFEEGLTTVTADAKRTQATTAPSREPKVVARTAFAFIKKIEDEAPNPPMSKERRP